MLKVIIPKIFKSNRKYSSTINCVQGNYLRFFLGGEGKGRQLVFTSHTKIWLLICMNGDWSYLTKLSVLGEKVRNNILSVAVHFHLNTLGMG